MDENEVLTLLQIMERSQSFPGFNHIMAEAGRRLKEVNDGLAPEPVERPPTVKVVVPEPNLAEEAKGQPEGEEPAKGRR